MEAIIKGKTYDTDTATCLGHKYFGEFGQPDGYEERLFVTEAGQHFIYGIGGAESPYAEPGIKAFTEKQAQEWLKTNETPAEEGSIEEVPAE